MRFIPWDGNDAMAFKMIVLDLDDTLLQEDLTISNRTRQALERAQSHGVRVVLASGRPTGAIWKYARELNLERHGGYILSFNGAVITKCATGEVIFQKALPVAAVHELFDLSVAQGVFIHSYVGDKIVTPKCNEYTTIEGALTGMEIVEVPDFKAAICQDPIKVILLEAPSILNEVAKQLRPVVAGRMNMCISKPFFLEFTDLGIDKRHSLSRLIDALGVVRDEVMAIGDSYNDVEMIKFAGLGICMANGPLEVQAIADHVTSGHMEDGVAEALDRFLFAA